MVALKESGFNVQGGPDNEYSDMLGLTFGL